MLSLGSANGPRGQHPFLAFSIPDTRLNSNPELDLGVESVFLRHASQIVPNLGLTRVRLTPARVWLEGEAVKMAWDVTGAARVRICELRSAHVVVCRQNRKGVKPKLLL